MTIASSRPSVSPLVLLFGAMEFVTYHSVVGRSGCVAELSAVLSGPDRKTVTVSALGSVVCEAVAVVSGIAHVSLGDVVSAELLSAGTAVGERSSVMGPLSSAPHAHVLTRSLMSVATCCEIGGRCYAAAVVGHSPVPVHSVLSSIP